MYAYCIVWPIEFYPAASRPIGFARFFFFTFFTATCTNLFLHKKAIHVTFYTHLFTYHDLSLRAHTTDSYWEREEKRKKKKMRARSILKRTQNRFILFALFYSFLSCRCCSSPSTTTSSSSTMSSSFCSVFLRFFFFFSLSVCNEKNNWLGCQWTLYSTVECILNINVVPPRGNRLQN